MLSTLHNPQNPQKCSIIHKIGKKIPKIHRFGPLYRFLRMITRTRRSIVVLKSTTTVIRNCDLEALGCCGMTIVIMVRTTNVVNSPRLLSEG